MKKYEVQKIGDQLRANTLIDISIGKIKYYNYLLNDIVEPLRIEALKLRYKLLKDEKYCNAIAYLNIK